MASYDMKYGVILADPPWQYRNKGVEGAAEFQYPTMSDGEIVSLPVHNYAADNCVLVLWATWPKDDVAHEVIKAWGFTYKTGFPWIKVTSVSPTLFGGIEFSAQYGTGFWVRGCSEPVKIAVKGKVSPNNDFYGLLSENLFHSRKPDNIYEYCESFPGPYLELFARRSRPGWDVFGNEVKNSISLNGAVAGG